MTWKKMLNPPKFSVGKDAVIIKIDADRDNQKLLSRLHVLTNTESI